MSPDARRSGPGPAGVAAGGAELLLEARARESAGLMPEAMRLYTDAIAAAERSGEPALLSEALRRLAVVFYRRDEPARARELCRRSYQVAREGGDDLRAAEALNTLGVMDLTAGSLEEARRTFLEALELGGGSKALCARVEQNLGILANIQGELGEALLRYGKSLAAYQSAEDRQGCAIAYHNLGMVSADREELDQAEHYFRQSRTLAEGVGDVHLQGLCLLNHAELDLARQRYENARQGAEAALALFDRLGTRGAKSDAYRVIGMVYRDTGRTALAEALLRSAIEAAADTGSVLSEAEACQELAILYQGAGKNQEALGLLNRAWRLFRRLNARIELVRVGGKVAQLEATYRTVARDWGRSIESTDSCTYGHCERVACDAVAMARILGLDEQEEATVLLGALLHDVGKIRAPHEILCKPGPLTEPELAVIRKHPEWGLELLANVEFPWDIKPIIRSHHEHYDGSGYPEGLRGEEIPLTAQIVGIVEVYDALTTMGAHQAPLEPREALERMERSRGWWSERVFAAFLAAVAGRQQDGPLAG